MTSEDKLKELLSADGLSTEYRNEKLQSFIDEKFKKENSKLQNMALITGALWAAAIISIFIIFASANSHIPQNTFTAFVLAVGGYTPTLAIISTIILVIRRSSFNRKVSQEQIAMSLRNIENQLTELKDEIQKKCN